MDCMNSNEQNILDRVKELYTSFPPGKINHSDSPDFIVSGSRNVGIEITQVFHDNNLDNSYYTETGGVVPNLRTEHLRNILDKKEAAKKSYKKCDEYWLLIREGSIYADSFDDIEVTNIPYTSFDKVLLFRQAENIIVELK